MIHKLAEFDSDYVLNNNWSDSLQYNGEQLLSFTNTTQSLVFNTNYTMNGLTVKVVKDGINFFNVDYKPYPRVNTTYNK